MSKKVMIVEDNELNMKLFRDLVQSLGHQVVEMRSGVNAVECAYQQRPDLILMDIQLPGISGLEVTKRLKEHEELSHIPIIAVTAFAMKSEEEHILKSGCEAYISKPISVAGFLKTIKTYLDESFL